MACFGSRATSSVEVKEVGLSWAATDEAQRKRIARAMSVLFMDVA